ncbi:hypothetical protein [Derxia gummosa]|uniref:Uncharacterized protein n=1 Tax=Derxia gummosa DSM 723 TaxID=1121388 RepID=A0A8B6X8F3_9BURK|nr:hypothetical protein [Derxia gummosa]
MELTKTPTAQLIAQIGRAAVISETGLTRARISQWCTENRIPRAWQKFLRGRFPEADWKTYDAATVAPSVQSSTGATALAQQAG